MMASIIKILDSPTTDLKKFYEKMDKLKGTFEFFYLFWCLFFEPIPRDDLKPQMFVDNHDKIMAISSQLS